MYIPYIFRSFQGFQTKEIKEFHSKRHMILILEPEDNRVRWFRKYGYKTINTS